MLAHASFLFLILNFIKKAEEEEEEKQNNNNNNNKRELKKKINNNFRTTYIRYAVNDN